MTQKEMTAQLKKKISLEITQISKSYKGFKRLTNAFHVWHKSKYSVQTIPVTEEPALSETDEYHQ